MCKKLIFLISFILIMLSSNVVQAGVVNRYSFNDGDTAAIDSVGGKDGTLEGTASISGNQLVLDGSGAAWLPSDTLDPGLTSVTIEAWVEVGSISTWARAFDFGGSSGSDGGNTMYFVPNNGGGSAQLTVSTTGFPSWSTGEESVTSDGLVPGTMTHVACVFDGSVPEIRYYQDGELKASLGTTMDLSLVARENAYIGDSSYSGDPYFNGSVDEFRIYDTALTDEEVLNSFNAGPDAALAGSCVEENILINGSFEDGFEEPWVFDNASPTYEVVEGEAADGAKALKVTIDAPGSSEYIPALAQPGFSFETGKYYTLSVFLKGSYDGMQVYLKPQERGGSWAGYGAAYVTMTTEWAEYSITTPVFTSDVATADVSIWLGMQAGDVYIDHVRFYEGDYVAPCPPEGPPPAIVKATQPMPENNSTDLTRFNMLSWTPGDYADSHNVYLGTDQQAVTDANVANPMDVLVSQQQADAFYDAAGDYGTTYYWRIDEVNEADTTIYKGNVWNFSTKAIGLIIPQSSIIAKASGSKSEDQDPNKTIDGSGLNAQNQHGTDIKTMWLSQNTTDPNEAWIQYDFDKVYKMPRMLIWNYNVASLAGGYGIQGIIIEYSADGGDNWTTLNTITELPKGPGVDTYGPVIVDLGGVADGLAANSIRIMPTSNWSNGLFKQYGLSEVKFYYIPVWPTNPGPADKATGVGVKPTLSWTAGEGSVEHTLYFGTDEQAVTDGTADSYTLANPTMVAPDLTLGTKYFWRVEEVNMASDPNSWSGNTWSFTTSDYRVVDDFESYDNSINKWTGGSSSSGNGAAIVLETAIANNGSNSMKFMYDDTSTQGYSEVSANPSQLTSGSNWTTGGPKWLVFWIYGDVSNLNSEKLYVKLNDALYWARQDIVPISEVLTPWWTQVTLELIPVQVSLNNVTSLKIGFTRTGSNTGTGLIHVDDIRLYKDAPTPIAPVNPGDANMVARYKMENNVNDSTSNHINGTIIGDPTYVMGPFSAYGNALAFDANEDVVDLGPADPFNFTGSFTISLWADIEDWGSEWGCVMAATRGEGTEGFQIRRGGGWIAGMQGKSGEGLSFTTRGISLDGMSNSEDMIVDPPALNRWTHIVCVYDMENSVKKVYFDSKLIQSSATPADAVLSPASQNASLGARANSGNTGFETLFKGSLDDVRFYNKALTDAEVRFLADPTP